MSVFRRRVVFREDRETHLLGSTSIVTATAVAATIVFAGTAFGNTSTTSGDASGSIVFAGSPVSEIVIEVSGSGAVALGGSATGVQRNLGFAPTGAVTLAGTARCDIIGSGAITFAGSATVGSVFTMDASGAVVFAGTVACAIGTSASGTVVFGGSVGAPDVTGGVVSSGATGAVAFGGTGVGTVGSAANVPQQFYFDSAFGVERSTLTTSHPEVILGNEQPASLVISGGEYSINGGTFASGATTVTAGDSVRLRHVSADEYSTPRVTTLTLSGVSGNFVSVTERVPPHHTPWHHRVFGGHKRRKA